MERERMARRTIDMPGSARALNCLLGEGSRSRFVHRFMICHGYASPLISAPAALARGARQDAIMPCSRPLWLYVLPGR
jgi:hypothetical protein